MYMYMHALSLPNLYILTDTNGVRHVAGCLMITRSTSWFHCKRDSQTCAAFSSPYDWCSIRLAIGQVRWAITDNQSDSLRIHHRSLSFYMNMEDGNDWIHAWTVFFMKNTVMILAWTLSCKNWLQNVGKLFHLQSALIWDLQFDSHCEASKQFSQVDWSTGMWVDLFYHHNETILFRESRHALRWVTAVAGEKFVFLIGCGCGARTTVGGSCQSICS